jgi:Flp pilus assembly pilin Flp
LGKIGKAVLGPVVRLQAQDGQAMAEYALVLALIALVCIAALTAIGLAISGSLGSITSLLGGGS